MKLKIEFIRADTNRYVMVINGIHKNISYIRPYNYPTEGYIVSLSNNSDSYEVKDEAHAVALAMALYVSGIERNLA